ncbi:hypothetical protein C9374_011150 [Naegleria lovaniensis]|uniref:Uncharacterized protein n=1 Tax=Naegleria lovaniensis TaxID=51637 RepID=A0AA88GH85_NAELO|nr:uncharacterized protein C9374_011150 [Naegleria lovaniensis]KAG2374071.1 hypothetical protein C9374_011150 [Naegleria lovaniensis]
MQSDGWRIIQKKIEKFVRKTVVAEGLESGQPSSSPNHVSNKELRELIGGEWMKYFELILDPKKVLQFMVLKSTMMNVMNGKRQASSEEENLLMLEFLNEFLQLCVKYEFERRIKFLASKFDPFIENEQWNNSNNIEKQETMNEKLADLCIATLIHDSSQFTSLNFMLDDSAYLLTIYTEFISLLSVNKHDIVLPVNCHDAFQNLLRLNETCGSSEIEYYISKVRKYFDDEILPAENSHFTILEIAKLKLEWSEMCDKKTSQQRKVKYLKDVVFSQHQMLDTRFVTLFSSFLERFTSLKRRQHSVKIEFRDFEHKLLIFSYCHMIYGTSIPCHMDTAANPTDKKGISTIATDENSSQHADSLTEFLAQKRQNSLKELSNIEQMVNHSFLEFKQIHPRSSASLEQTFTSYANEPLRYEKMNEAISKQLSKQLTEDMRRMQSAFDCDPMLKYMFGTPSQQPFMKTENSMHSLSLTRDTRGDMCLILDDCHEISERSNYNMLTFAETELEERKDSFSLDMLTHWRNEIISASEEPVSNHEGKNDAIHLNDMALLCSSLVPELFHCPFKIREGDGGESKNKHTTLDYLIATFTSQANVSLAHLKKLYSEYSQEFVETQTVPILPLDFVIQRYDKVYYMLRTRRDCAERLCELFEVVSENLNSSANWLDDYAEEYRCMFQIGEDIRHRKHTSTISFNSFNMLRYLNDRGISSTEFTSSDPIEMLTSFLNDVCSPLETIEKDEILKCMTELLSSLKEELFLNLENIGQMLGHLNDFIMQSLNTTVLLARKNLENSISLMLMLSILSKTGSKFFTNYRTVAMQKAQYFLSKLLEMLTVEIHDRFSHTNLFYLLRKIQILSITHSCLFDIRNSIFVQYCHQRNDYLQAMKFITEHFRIQPLSVMLKNYPQLSACALNIGQHSKLLVDRKLRLFMNYHFLIPEFNRYGLNKLLSSQILVPKSDIFNWIEKSIERESLLSSLTQIPKIVFPLHVNPNETLDERAIQEHYTLFEKQVKDIIALNQEIIELETKGTYENNDETHKQLAPTTLQDLNTGQPQAMINFEDVLEDLSNVCEVFIFPSSDSEFLTNDPEKIKRMLLDSLPIILFDILHSFPDSINQWTSFIVQQLLSYLKSPECTMYLSRFFKNFVKNPTLETTTWMNVEISTLLATYCCRYVFKTIQEIAMKLCEHVFEMCLVVEASLFSQYRFSTKWNVNHGTIQSTIANSCNNIKELLNSATMNGENQAGTCVWNHLKEQQHFKEEKKMSQLLNLFAITEKEPLFQLLSSAVDHLCVHIIEDRLLNYHLKVSIPSKTLNPNDFSLTDRSIPLVKTLELVGLQHSKKLLSALDECKQLAFFELDFEEYADILQEVIQMAQPHSQSKNMKKISNNKTETETTRHFDENTTTQQQHILLYLHQVMLVLGNYPFHKLLRTTQIGEHNSLPYLHPIMHSTVLSTIASNPLVEMGVKKLNSFHKLRLGKLMDDLVRKCHLAQCEAQTQFMEQMKKDLLESSHEMVNVKNEVDQVNRSLLERLLKYTSSTMKKCRDSIVP